MKTGIFKGRLKLVRKSPFEKSLLRRTSVPAAYADKETRAQELVPAQPTSGLWAAWEDPGSWSPGPVSGDDTPAPEQLSWIDETAVGLGSGGVLHTPAECWPSPQTLRVSCSHRAFGSRPGDPSCLAPGLLPPDPTWLPHCKPKKLGELPLTKDAPAPAKAAGDVGPGRGQTLRLPTPAPPWLACLTPQSLTSQTRTSHTHRQEQKAGFPKTLAIAGVTGLHFVSGKEAFDKR